MYHKLKDGAIFIADSHYPNHKKEEFINFLESIKSKKIKTPQLFLMGDIFDLLVGNSSYLKNKFAYEIKLIEDISKNIEVIYLEGNHDFHLSPIFKNIKVIPIAKQPIILEYNSKKYAISHGDKYNTTISYRIFSFFIRNPFVLKILPDLIAKKKLKDMQSKKICKKIKKFKVIIKKIKKEYKSDYIIEGHFHQGVQIENYYSLPSFACNEKVAIFDAGKIIYTKFK